jgi:hypothetical protein
MTERLFIQPIPNRLAPPHRSDRLVLGAPIGRTHRAIPLLQEASTSRMKCPGAETAGFAPYRQDPIAASPPTENALSP